MANRRVGFDSYEVRRALNNMQADIETQIFYVFSIIGRIMREKVKEEIQRQSLIASEELYRSIDFEIYKIGMDIVLRVFSTKQYAMAIEKGARPHRPPMQAIAQWIIQKRRRVGTLAIPRDEIRSVAYAITKSIAVKGTKATHFFRLGLMESLREIRRRELLEDAVIRVMERHFKRV